MFLPPWNKVTMEPVGGKLTGQKDHVPKLHSTGTSFRSLQNIDVGSTRGEVTGPGSTQRAMESASTFSTLLCLCQLGEPEINSSPVSLHMVT